jgi:hypothetical protein
MEVWNRTYPIWAYDRVTVFARDIDRAEMLLRFPKYHIPPDFVVKCQAIDIVGFISLLI